MSGKRKKEAKASNVILLAMGIFALGFITAMTVIFCVKDAVPDSLIQYTLGAGGLEALLLAGIKISKILRPSCGPGKTNPVGKDGIWTQTEFFPEEETGSGGFYSEAGFKSGESEDA